MPRKADPNLERTIVDAAIRLLEKGGLEAITMREVAKAARTTTPTLYERFTDRDALLRAITDIYRDELSRRFDAHDSIERMGDKFLEFCIEKPHAIELLIERVAQNLKGDVKGPIYSMVRSNLMKLNGFPPKQAEELTLATTSTIAGAALMMSRLGCTSRASRDLHDATVKMLRRVALSNTRR
jgi:AcrR family transcriptional regulator